MRLRFVQSLLAVALLASVLGLAGCGGKEDCMPWQDLLGRDDGYLPKFIEMGGEIGYMYLPGIYYFSNTFCGKLPRTGLQT